MTEQFSPSAEFDNEAAVMDTFEKAYGDSVIQDAIRESKYRAKNFDMSGSIIEFEERIRKTIEELDEMVKHAIDQPGKLSGIVRSNEGDAGIRKVSTSNALIEFKGFVSDHNFETQTIEFNLAFLAAYNSENDLFLTLDNIDEMTETGERDNFTEIGMAVSPDEVFVEYYAIHPIRANAWLEITYPSIISELDGRIIYDENTAEEQSILGLKGFALDLSNLKNTDDINMCLGSINRYVNAMITVDKDVPYWIDINGECLDAANPEQDWAQLQETGALYTVQSLYLFAKDDAENDDLYKFAFHGSIHHKDAMMPSRDVVAPLDSITSLASLRPRIVYEIEE